MAVANPGGIASLDPVNDLHLKGVDVVEASMRLRVLQESLKEFSCIHSPTFDMQVSDGPLSEHAEKRLSYEPLNHLLLARELHIYGPISN